MLHIFPAVISETQKVCPDMDNRIPAVSTSLCCPQWTTQVLETCCYSGEITLYRVLCSIHLCNTRIFRDLETYFASNSGLCHSGSLFPLLYHILLPLWTPRAGNRWRNSTCPAGWLVGSLDNMVQLILLCVST
ncbi:hypothetical protein BOH78_4315 [Pichia kudriavzevii]|uniref:Uncharacterized protein n=1 Tax=Pichia kudriavzevii TaxID=4909 RepID=A0A1V2LHE4_PICKU|nr:hypothetical protein BOH78_4315 [Pichia kudriavzevii]